MSTGIRENRAIIAAGIAAALSLWGVKAAAQAFPSQGTPGAGIGSDLVGRLSNYSGRERRVEVELSGQAHYDSNVARGGTAVAALRSVRQDDYIYVPSAKLILSLPAAGQYVFLEGSAGYDFHQYNKLLERERIDMLAGLTTSLGPCQGSLQGAYGRHQSDLADLALTVTKNTVQQTSLGVQGSCSTGRGLSEYIGYEHSKSSNTAGTGVVDADVDAVNGGVQYGTRTLGDIGVSVSYSKVNYDNPTSLAPVAVPSPTGFETVSAQLTFRRPVGNRLVGMAEIGYSKAKPTGLPVVAGAATPALSREFTGVTGLGSLSYAASSRLQLTLTYQRSVTPTIQNGSNFAVQQNFGLHGEYKLTTRLSASLGVDLSERTFSDQAIPIPGLVTNDRQRSIFGALHLKVGRSASLALDARQDDRNTNLTLFNYNAYRVGVTATQTF